MGSGWDSAQPQSLRYMLQYVSVPVDLLCLLCLQPHPPSLALRPQIENPQPGPDTLHSSQMLLIAPPGPARLQLHSALASASPSTPARSLCEVRCGRL